MERAFEELKIVKVKAAVAAGTTAIECDTVDLQDYDGVMFVTTVGAITSGGAQSVKVQEGDTSTPADDVTGLAITIADDDDGQSFVLDFKKGLKRYARLYISRASQNSAFGEVYAILYGARLKPVVNAVANTLTVDNN